MEVNQTIVSPVSTIFRVFDDGYTVRSMTPSDTAIAQQYMVSIGIAIPPSDLPMLLDLYPPGSRGFYVGEFEGQVVASVLQVPWGGNVLYVGCFFVDEKFRRRGFGSRLLNVVAREHAGNATVVLDAVEGWVGGTYQSWGFKEVYKLEFFRGVAQSTYDHLDSFDGMIQPVSKDLSYFLWARLILKLLAYS